MPKYVDASLRRDEILSAAYSVVEEDGLAGVSFRAVAAKLGGSSTLVTHYYASRQALVEDLIAFSLDRWTADLKSLETGIDDPKERLRVLLEWLLPVTAAGLREERARLNLLTNHQHDEETQAMLRKWDVDSRKVVRRHLQPLVAKGDLDDAAEALSLTIYGIALSAVQNPSAWPRRRQLKAVAIQLRLLGLANE